MKVAQGGELSSASGARQQVRLPHRPPSPSSVTREYGHGPREREWRGVYLSCRGLYQQTCRNMRALRSGASPGR